MLCQMHMYLQGILSEPLANLIAGGLVVAAAAIAALRRPQLLQVCLGCSSAQIRRLRNTTTSVCNAVLHPSAVPATSRSRLAAAVLVSCCVCESQPANWFRDKAGRGCNMSCTGGGSSNE